MPGAVYTAGAVIRHGDMLYRVLTDVTALAHQQPGGEGMLSVYAQVQVQSEEDGAAGAVLEWVSGEAGLVIGDRCEFSGVVYEAIQEPGANIWAPDTAPAIWKAVA